MSAETVFWQIWGERGKRSEDKVRSALEFLIEEGRIERIIRNRSLDIRGIDFLVRVGSKNYKLSVKSSLGGVERELKEYPERHRHGDIIFIVPQGEETAQEIAERIISLIDSFEERMHNK